MRFVPGRILVDPAALVYAYPSIDQYDIKYKYGVFRVQFLHSSDHDRPTSFIFYADSLSPTW